MMKDQKDQKDQKNQNEFWGAVAGALIVGGLTMYLGYRFVSWRPTESHGVPSENRECAQVVVPEFEPPHDAEGVRAVTRANQDKVALAVVREIYEVAQEGSSGKIWLGKLSPTIQKVLRGRGFMVDCTHTYGCEISWCSHGPCGAKTICTPP